ncbi:MAG TPA: His-Xaa-Ser system radical SAM maturase HxsB [Candidatus Acidoferrales bacterium]|nr:His-Xaa-Ser system radical SAM maturase HxsB [Candidatus Acidoferrales bacterium]
MNSESSSDTSALLPRGRQVDFARLSSPANWKPEFAVPYNQRIIGSKILISNDLGDWLLLTHDEFRDFIEGRPQPGEPLYEKLRQTNFIAADVDLMAQAERWRRKKRYLFFGPTLHAFVLTHRCNHGCQYCHSSIVGMERTDTDMSIETARRGVDLAFSTTSPAFTIEFQGGEPTANWDVLKFIVDYAREKNTTAGKILSFALVTNLSLMDDEKLDFLIDRKVQICTSLDGPADLHNKIRIFKGGNSHELLLSWMKKINQRYADMGLDVNQYRVEALPTITRPSLTRWKDIVDQFVEAGCRAIFLRKLDPFGFAAKSAKTLGYSMDEFLEFYARAVDYIIELNRQGVQVMERHAAIMLNKILADEEPNYLDLRIPGGACIGQMGYAPDGSIYSSDEGRFVAAMGDDMFRIGSVEDDYHTLMTNASTRALVMAGLNDGQPDCISCVYKPWCGQQVEYNYKTQGSLHGHMRDSVWCRKHKSIFDYLMHKLESADDTDMEMFRLWTTNRTLDHFIVDG